MDFLPHTDEDEREMLARIGMASLEELFEPIAAEVRLDRPLDVPAALSEPELVAHATRLARSSKATDEIVCFAGGGAYDHYVPPVVRSLATRAEFATAYTPYQPELSQGVLQALYEFQSAICELFGMEVANASLYDGSSALAEAVNLAVRATGRDSVLVGATVHPHYVDVLRTYTSGLGLGVELVGAAEGGSVDWSHIPEREAAAVVVASPNFFGGLEDVEQAASAAHASGALCIAISDPTAMGVLRPPGAQGADVAVGEGQGLGNDLAYGGPYVGLFATKLGLVRQVPGRISGETQDADGRRAYVLTLQAREQHIRRARATSNVCTNQTLLAIANAIHLAWLGPSGLARVGEICARRTAYAAGRLAELPGCDIAFPGPRFKEFVLRTPVDASELASRMARRGYVVGPALGRYFPALSQCLLVAVTERRSEGDVEGLAEAFEKELAER